MKDDTLFYRSQQTHLIPKGAALFITFGLHSSIPHFLVKKHKAKFRSESELIKNSHTREEVIHIRMRKLKASLFEKYEGIMHKGLHGRHWLKDPAIASIVKEKIHELDQKMYRLLCYCIMSNHIHLIIDLSGSLSYADPLHACQPKESIGHYPKIMQLIKGSTAYQINRYLNRNGKFWQRDNFERYIRSEKHLFRVINYTLNNPVKANISRQWEHYPHNYLAPELYTWLQDHLERYPHEKEKVPTPW